LRGLQNVLLRGLQKLRKRIGVRAPRFAQRRQHAIGLRCREARKARSKPLLRSGFELIQASSIERLPVGRRFSKQKIEEFGSFHLERSWRSIHRRSDQFAQTSQSRKLLRRKVRRNGDRRHVRHGRLNHWNFFHRRRTRLRRHYRLLCSQ
jgi:hypothetical protein